MNDNLCAENRDVKGVVERCVGLWKMVNKMYVVLTILLSSLLLLQKINRAVMMEYTHLHHQRRLLVSQMMDSGKKRAIGER